MVEFGGTVATLRTCIVMCHLAMNVLIISVGKYVDACLHYLNWNLMNGRCLEECVKEILGTATQPFHITMKIQDEKGREVYNQIVYENLSQNKALNFF